MRRVSLILVMILVTSCGSRNDRSGVRSVPEGEPWNVVMILVDTLRADHLPFYGYERPTSPALSELAQSGIVFENAWSQAGCTFPSVNSLLTSSWPQSFVEGREDHGLGIPDHLWSLPEVLGEQGYATGAVSASTIVRVNPSQHNPEGGYGDGFDRFEDDCLRQPAACVNERAFEMLDEFPEPFFLYLHYMEPHMPFQPPDSHPRRFATGYEGKPWVANGQLLPLKEMLYDGGPEVTVDERDIAHTVDLYDEEILFLDTGLERLFQGLRSRGLWERSLIVFVADHGEELLDHGHLFHCRDMLYNTVIKTPLVFWIPGIEQPKRVGSLAQNLDVVPTIVDYLGFSDDRFGLHGKSLRPLIDEDRQVNRYAFASQRFARSITDGRYKLIYNLKTGESSLYDLQRDPEELTDIQHERPEGAEELMKVMIRWVEAVEGGHNKEERLDRAEKTMEMLRAVGYL